MQQQIFLVQHHKHHLMEHQVQHQEDIFQVVEVDMLQVLVDQEVEEQHQMMLVVEILEVVVQLVPQVVQE